MTETTLDIQIPEVIPELERGPKWLRDKRHAARDDYNNTPIPPRGLHLWRYTDPGKFVINRDKIADSTFGDSNAGIEKFELENLKTGNISALATDKGGRDIRFYGIETLAKAGVIITSLSEAVEKYPEMVGEYLYKLVNSRTGKFEAMNGALWNDGIFIYIPDGRTIEKPLHLLREAALANSAQFPRLLVVVGRNSELTIVDEYGGGSTSSTDGSSYTNAAVEIFGLADSRTRYVLLQRQASTATTYLSHRARIEQGATMLTIPLAFGGSLSKHHFGVIMNGAGAESKMLGLLFGSGYQHFDHHTLHEHAAGKTHSDIDFKVVLRDKALSAYTGLIRIDNRARTCEAYQENRNLLLNKGCRAETIPELEILNEDVICTHGATIGPIDPMMVFYLRSRGVPDSEAVRMIVSGFVEKTLQALPKDLHDRISEFVAERLERI